MNKNTAQYRISKAEREALIATLPPEVAILQQKESVLDRLWRLGPPEHRQKYRQIYRMVTARLVEYGEQYGFFEEKPKGPRAKKVHASPSGELDDDEEEDF